MNELIGKVKLYESIDSYVELCHGNSVKAGWWPELPPSMFMAGARIALIHSEISELVEAVRRGNLQDEHLLSYGSEEVEAADVLIRLFDLCGALRVQGLQDKYDELSTRQIFGEDWEDMVEVLRGDNVSAGWYLGSLHCSLSLVGSRLMRRVNYEGDIVRFIFDLMHFCRARGLSVESAMNAKIEFNKHRLDHQLSNRGLKGGKEF